MFWINKFSPVKTKPAIILVSLFIIWRIITEFFLISSFFILPLNSSDFLGGGFYRYNAKSYTLPWSNYDGEHYLSIAANGYKGIEQAFFPVYPGLIAFFSGLSKNPYVLSLSGLFISNVCFLISIFLLFKLLKLDFSEKDSLLIILLIMTFPTSFYFGALYNESLFLMLTLLSFYFARKKRWFLSVFFCSIASGTRIFGVALFPAILIEMIQARDKKALKWLFIAPLGLVLYMLYLWWSVGDPVAFYSLQINVGQQHQRGVVLYPQVIYRYLKILFSINFSPLYQTILLELITGILFFVLPVIGFFKKIRLSYLFYALVGFLLPTIQGSFSSTPRYVIVLFPSFIVGYLLLKKMPKYLFAAFLTLCVILLGIESALFLRGYWVA